MCSKWDVQLRKVLAISTKLCAKELSTKVQFKIFCNCNERLGERESCRHHSAIANNQLRAITEADACKTTGEVAEKANVNHSTFDICTESEKKMVKNSKYFCTDIMEW